MKLLRIIAPIIVLIVALVFALSGCTDTGLDPIFFTLATERELIEDKGLAENITVWEIVKVGNRYYLAADTLYTRTESGSKWEEVSPPESGARCATVEVYIDSFSDEYLYAGFFSMSGAEYGLYRTDANPPSKGDWDNTAFNAVVVDKPIGMIKTAGANLYVTVADTSVSPQEYFLYESDFLGTTFSALTFDINPTAPITDIVVYPGPERWVTAGPNLYSDTVAPPPDFTQHSGEVGYPSITEGKVYSGLLYSSDKLKMYLSTKDGKIWSYDGTWTSSAEIEVDDDPVRFTHFVELETTSSDIYVGSQGGGYFILGAGSIDSITRYADYDISVMRNGSINRFLADPTPNPDTLFACTAGAGLWRADYESPDWVWVQEASK